MQYASAVQAVALCLSACLSQAGIVPKWLNIASHITTSYKKKHRDSGQPYRGANTGRLY